MAPNTISIFLPAILISIGVGVLILLLVSRRRSRMKYRPAAKEERKGNFFDIEDGGFRGMRSWPAIGRWAAVIPMSFLCAFIATWPFRAIDTLSHMRPTDPIGMYLLHPVASFLSSFGAVAGAGATAPRWRSLVAAGMTLVIVVISRLALSAGYPMFQLAMTWIGSAVGLSIIAKAQREALQDTW